MPATRTQTLVERRYVSIDETAEYLSTSSRTVRRLIAAGELTGYRLGKRLLRVDLNELDAMLRPIPTTSAS